MFLTHKTINLINNNRFSYFWLQISGLKWHNKGHQEFIIPWKHGSTQGWSKNKDSELYRLWRKHKGTCVCGVVNTQLIYLNIKHY